MGIFGTILLEIVCLAGCLVAVRVLSQNDSQAPAPSDGGTSLTLPTHFDEVLTKPLTDTAPSSDYGSLDGSSTGSSKMSSIIEPASTMISKMVTTASATTKKMVSSTYNKAAASSSKPATTKTLSASLAKAAKKASKPQSIDESEGEEYEV